MEKAARVIRLKVQTFFNKGATMNVVNVIFVGLHNKPNTRPLCGSTKSGRLIDKIIAALGSDRFRCLKTNLYDVDYMPSPAEREALANDWLWRVMPDADDVVVALGAAVHEGIGQPPGRLIKVAHPASKRSKEAMSAYVKDVVQQIAGKGCSPQIFHDAL